MSEPRNAMDVRPGYRGRAFTSDLSGQEFWLVVDKGFQPMGLVVGNCIYSMGAVRNWLVGIKSNFQGELREYTELMYQARELALSRMQFEADQLGALQLLAGKSYGLVSLWLLGIGFAAYALWRLSEAAFGVTGDRPGAGPRLKSLGRAVIYGGFSYLAFTVISGSDRSQSRQQQPLPAQHHEQQQSGSKIHYPHERRCQGRESAENIGDTRDGKGEGKSLLREFESL